jgi:hypothetical protein
VYSAGGKAIHMKGTRLQCGVLQSSVISPTLSEKCSFKVISGTAVTFSAEGSAEGSGQEGEEEKMDQQTSEVDTVKIGMARNWDRERGVCKSCTCMQWSKDALECVTQSGHCFTPPLYFFIPLDFFLVDLLSSYMYQCSYHLYSETTSIQRPLGPVPKVAYTVHFKALFLCPLKTGFTVVTRHFKH